MITSRQSHFNNQHERLKKKQYATKQEGIRAASTFLSSFSLFSYSALSFFHWGPLLFLFKIIYSFFLWMAPSQIWKLFFFKNKNEWLPPSLCRKSPLFTLFSSPFIGQKGSFSRGCCKAFCWRRLGHGSCLLAAHKDCRSVGRCLRRFCMGMAETDLRELETALETGVGCYMTWTFA